MTNYWSAKQLLKQKLRRQAVTGSRKSIKLATPPWEQENDATDKPKKSRLEEDTTRRRGRSER